MTTTARFIETDAADQRRDWYEIDGREYAVTAGRTLLDGEGRPLCQLTTDLHVDHDAAIEGDVAQCVAATAAIRTARALAA